MLVECLWAFGGLLVALYFFLTATFDSFDQKRIPFRKPYPLLGTMAPLFLKRKNLAQLTQDFYHEFKSFGLGGVFHVRKPVVVICDPEIVKTVCVKEHDCFVDHNLPVGEYIDGLFEKSLLALKGKRWHDVRTTLNPAFSPDLIKGVLPLVSECGQGIVDHLKQLSRKNSSAGDGGGGGSVPCAVEVELRELFSRGVADVAAAAAFGAPSSITFLQMGRAAASASGRKSAVVLGHLLCPAVMEMLGVSLLGAGVQSYFRELVRDALVARERDWGSGHAPCDMLQRLVEARRGHLAAPKGSDDADGSRIPGGPAAAAEEHALHGNGGPPVVAPLSDDDVAAQLLLFFLAGFDTVSTALCFLGHLLAVHPSVQDRVAKEVEEALAATDGTLSYATLQKMPYLDMVISETLRMYPPTPVAGRTCTRTAAIKGTSRRPGFVLRPGDAVWIPIYAIQNDPELFPEPDKFDPERFSEKNKHNIVPFSYIPFGTGPRNCIGNHFALMEMKVIMTHLLSSFSLKVTEKTPSPLKLSKKTCQMDVDEGFWVGMESKEKKYQIKVQI